MEIEEEISLNEEKGKKKRILLLCLLLLLISFTIAIVSFLIYRAKPVTRLQKEEAALAGLLPGKSEEDIQKILQQVVARGMVNISIESEVLFERNGRKGRIGIENIPGNKYSYRVDLILDSTGDILYKSGLIEPGYYIDYISLDKKLKPGRYKATARFRTYDVTEEKDDLIAEVNAEINLTVINGVYYE